MLGVIEIIISYPFIVFVLLKWRYKISKKGGDLLSYRLPDRAGNDKLLGSNYCFSMIFFAISKLLSTVPRMRFIPAIRES